MVIHYVGLKDERLAPYWRYCGCFVFLYTETDKLDAPIAKTEAMVKKIENKVGLYDGNKNHKNRP